MLLFWSCIWLMLLLFVRAIHEKRETILTIVFAVIFGVVVVGVVAVTVYSYTDPSALFSLAFYLGPVSIVFVEVLFSSLVAVRGFSCIR